jgi:D-alanine-D-alanine ligase-like ATP-grasp enzyme
LEKPLIVKPRLGSLGRHTTTSIQTLADLCVGFFRAKKLCYWVIVEEHLVGSVYRATFVDGVLEGVLAGEPPRVVGDGISAISELVALKNKLKNPKISEIVLEQVHGEFLARKGLSTKSIPKEGEVVDLLEKIGVSYGGNSIEVTEITHADIKKELTRAWDTLADPLIGLDFIIPDITASPYSQKWGIIECNGCPFINLHHDPVEGTPRNVAGKVWDYVERNLDKF